jgi:hypothetical protein
VFEDTASALFGVEGLQVAGCPPPLGMSMGQGVNVVDGVVLV